MHRLPRASRLIFTLGLETGLRIGDILRLKIRDIRNPLHVYVGRLGMVDLFPISAELHRELINTAAFGRDPDDYIFNARRSCAWKWPLNRSTYHRDIKRATEGLNFDCSAHSTRQMHIRSAENVRNSTD
jgi:integrase